MKKVLTALLVFCLWQKNFSQSTEPKPYTDFPIVVTLQFHAFALPFRDLKTNFSNMGIGIGTEFSLNGTSNWVQQVSLIWYHNKALGNGLMPYTQAVWRPAFNSTTYGETKLGIGYLYSFKPTETLHQVNGQWVSSGHRGKGMLTIPLGVSLGYTMPKSENLISHFVTYQFLLVKNYNTSIPVVPETLVQIGSRVHFK